MIKTVGKTFCCFLIKLNIRLLHKSKILPWVFVQDNNVKLYVNTYSGFIFKLLKIGSNSNVQCLQCRISCSISVQWNVIINKKNKLIDIQNRMDEFQMHYAKWKESDSKCCNDFIYMMLRKWNSKDRKQTAAAVKRLATKRHWDPWMTEIFIPWLQWWLSLSQNYKTNISKDDFSLCISTT